MSSRLRVCWVVVLCNLALVYDRNDAADSPQFDGSPVLGESVPPAEILKFSKAKGLPIFVSWCVIAVPEDYYCCALWSDGTVLVISKKAMVNKVVVLSAETFQKYKKVIDAAANANVARTTYKSPDCYPFHNFYVYDGKNEKFYSLDASESPPFKNTDVENMQKVWIKLSAMREEMLDL